MKLYLSQAPAGSKEGTEPVRRRTEQKASLLIDAARAFFQWAKYEQAHAALRAAADTAAQEVAARPSVGTLARDLATLALASIRRDAEQFATRIGATR